MYKNNSKSRKKNAKEKLKKINKLSTRYTMAIETYSRMGFSSFQSKKKHTSETIRQ